MCTDKLGMVLSVGDTVLYAMGARSDDSLYKGKVTGMEGSFLSIKAEVSNRTIQRYSSNVLSAELHKREFPEDYV